MVLDGSTVKAFGGQSLLAVYQRLKAAEWGVANVATHDGAEANSSLVGQMRTLAPDVVVEAVPLLEILSNPLAKAIVEEHLGSVGITGIPTGYYLLHRGDVVAFHPAAPTLDELKVGGAAVLGATVVGLMFRAPEVIGAVSRGATTFWEQAAAARAFAFFQSVFWHAREAERRAQSDDSWRRAAREQSRLEDDVAFGHACTALGIGPDAAEPEFKKSFRAAAKRHHPDRHAPGDKFAAEQRMKAINAAADLYARRRGWKR